MIGHLDDNDHVEDEDTTIDHLEKVAREKRVKTNHR